MFAWYLTSSSIDTGGIRDGLAVTSLDICFFSICFVQILANILLVVGSLKRIPSYIIPWLCTNAVFMMITMIFIGYTILFGTSKLLLNYNEYVTSLIIMGIITAINLFCWIVIFTFRQNLIMEAQRSSSVNFELQPVNGQCPAVLMPNAPPPSYYEPEGSKECKPPLEDAPPEYEVAVAMLPPEKGPVQRKNSLNYNRT